MEREKLLANHIWWVNIQNVLSKKSHIQLKSGQRSWTDIFPKEDIQMTNRYMKRCSPSLITREIQIQTTMRYYLIPIRMTVIRKIRNNKCWWGCGEKEIFLHCWWECKLVQPLWKTVWKFLKKLKVDLPYDPTIPFLGVYPKEISTGSQKRYLYPHVHFSTIYDS